MSQRTIEWILERRVLFVCLEGRLTGDDLKRLDDDVIARLNDAGVTEAVHFVEDIRGLTNAPPLSVALNLRMIRDARLGWSISIGAVRNPILRLVYQSLVMTAGVRWRDRASLEQALQYLNRIDSSLPDLAGWTSKEPFSTF